MLYKVFYYLIKFTCFFYFRKISIYNSENLSAGKPTIICANHGNSFMDAILIAINSKRKLHFLVRADVFNTPFKRWFFGQLNMMPIYRLRDGREALKNNDRIFLKCRKILHNNGAVVIFPEGNCIVEKRLRTFKTGFVHLAFNTPLENLEVLPVAINYSKPDEFYADVSLNFLPAIAVEEIKLTSKHKEFEFNKLLMMRTHEALRQNMVIIPNKEDEVFYEKVLEMKRNSFVAEQPLLVEKQIETADHLTKLAQREPVKFDALKQLVAHYNQHLQKENIKDIAVAKPNMSSFKFALVFPFYFFGLLLNLVPSFILKHIVTTKIKERQFKSSVRMVLSLFIYVSYMWLASASLNLIFGNFMLSSIIIIGMMLFYYFCFAEFELFYHHKTLKKDPSTSQQLATLRLQVINSINLSSSPKLKA